MDTRARNVFVVGLNDTNRERLESLRGAGDSHFHGVIDPEAVYDTEVFDIASMLDEATEQLEAFDGSVDAIVGYMDFPVSTMLPILCERFGTRSPSLSSLLKCEHKYWSRRVQEEVIPDYIPAFTAFDPFDDDALTHIGEAGLYFPFFVKPIKSSGSRLGFRIDTPEDFYHAIEKLREDIGLIADPFNTVLEQARLPDEIAAVDGHFCMAEEIIGGWQCTVEGYVFEGEVVSYGIVDSLRYPQVLSFFHYRYPSGLPDPVQDKMRELTDTVMRHIGFDNSAFNIEYFWDEVQDRIWLLEINTRISQSHCDLFEKVDGVSHQQVTVDLALGRRPDMPHRRGDYAVAAKFFYRVFFVDAVVTRVPSDEEINALEADFPGSVIALQVEPGQRLSNMPEQDSYSYALAYIWMGAESEERLLDDYERLAARLMFDFDEIEG
ncbi:ATP-grasp domain-containing protein [Halomonas elongata]|uniref:ATP-grasp domain-containing protein n=1 Tax=Halomonas elongata (strain ATCC 33173 / DSM 2581 / NBRC 15536 / NCIMB 2198 / 1H9) TaxID=768066 RepID=E1V9C2_HALED|nr:ATP-grasp domain-containing protein [Halomonas elongata]MDL4863563.1 ATP-grasp domain-containing protein [Halomonas elongata]RAW07914.1 ATP-grasp domain-containing protein [Halomonas elongata]WBF17532.1 ATP-grasp domain-containing protein [Halomonas elongata]WPU46371.1 ATP-grasp domain-containing protein [Halomonas elongata DSM 2581]CBV43794.1 ATP-grasp fold protein [Halomonas elongata DSM 2581]